MKGWVTRKHGRMERLVDSWHGLYHHSYLFGSHQRMGRLTKRQAAESVKICSAGGCMKASSDWLSGVRQLQDQHCWSSPCQKQSPKNGMIKRDLQTKLFSFWRWSPRLKSIYAHPGKVGSRKVLVCAEIKIFCHLGYSGAFRFRIGDLRNLVVLTVLKSHDTSESVSA